MNYHDFQERSSFSHEELLAFAHGRLVADPPADFDSRLPQPPLLMLDRIVSITRGRRSGQIIGEQDVRLDAWYFQCHLPGDPVHPGCLCVDAIWQLLGFYCLWHGALGFGRALGCEEIVFNGQIRPFNRLVRHEVTIKRFAPLSRGEAAIVIGDAKIFVDGEHIMDMKGAKTGIFRNIGYTDYPLRSANSVGGALREET
jgi:3-hydroxyacyl-[acyl-carrier protein] dehydratase/trans-2-decenoyl-[acyl-carrier protein] isomerase